MTYAQGGLIQATDYNGFVASVNAVWGTGSSDSGYGQSTTLSTVAASNTITASQWSTLIARLDSISNHQSGASSGITAPSAGNVITYLSTLSSTISTLTTNRLNFNTQGTTSNTTVSNTNTWVTTCTKEISLTFANASAMRYFFNCGGQIIFTAEGSTLSGNSKSTDWDALLAACGQVRIRAQASAKVGGSGTPSVNNTNLGFYDLTTSYQSILQQYSTTVTGGYNTNNALFEAKVNLSPGSATVLTVKMTFSDASGDTDAANDLVSGNVIAVASVTYPELTYLSNVWGTVTAATVTNTQS